MVSPTTQTVSDAAQLKIVPLIAKELGVGPDQVKAAVALLDEGSTVPFIARYRKEATGGLDETQLRAIQERSEYLRELGERRAAIHKSIDEQGTLTPELAARLDAATTKQALEDLYLPYKPKRRTRAIIARERGLEPLADLLWSGELDDAAALIKAAEFVSVERDVPLVDDALAGARDILSERIAEDAELRGWVRDLTRRKGSVASRAVAGKENDVSKFQDYYDFSEPLGGIPSHRVLAIRRGEEEGVLAWSVTAPVEEIHSGLNARVSAGRRAMAQLGRVAQDAYKRLLAFSIEVELRLELKTRADEEAIAIFGRNLEQLLLAAPAGERIVIGLDPGFRTGVKVAAVSRTGAVLHTDAWMLHQPDRFSAALVRLATSSGAALIAIGNGTASRETEAIVRQTLRDSGMATPPQVVVVSEAGASVYSASELAVAELPGRHRGERGESRGRGSEHGVGRAAVVRVRHRPGARGEHREDARRAGGLRFAQGVAEGAAPWRKSVRAGGGIPARARGHASPRRERRAPRALRTRGAHGGGRWCVARGADLRRSTARGD